MATHTIYIASWPEPVTVVADGYAMLPITDEANGTGAPLLMFYLGTPPTITSMEAVMPWSAVRLVVGATPAQP